MSKLMRFIPQIYMILCMTLSISFIHYMLGHAENFWTAWLGAVIIATPLALFFSSWIGPIMRRLNAGNHR